MAATALMAAESKAAAVAATALMATEMKATLTAGVKAA